LASSLSCHTVPVFFFHSHATLRALHSFPTRRSSDLCARQQQTLDLADRHELLHEERRPEEHECDPKTELLACLLIPLVGSERRRSEEHTSELQSRSDLVCRLLLEKKKKKTTDLAANE